MKLTTADLGKLKFSLLAAVLMAVVWLLCTS